VTQALKRICPPWQQKKKRSQKVTCSSETGAFSHEYPSVQIIRAITDKIIDIPGHQGRQCGTPWGGEITVLKEKCQGKIQNVGQNPQVPRPSLEKGKNAKPKAKRWPGEKVRFKKSNQNGL